MVNLYGPETTPVTTQRRTSWLGALAIMVMTPLAAVAPALLGMTPTYLWMLVFASGFLGLVLLGWSFLVRNRRLPALVLVGALAVGAATTAGTVLMSAPPATTIAVLEEGSVVAHTFTAQPNAVLDLRETPPGTEAEVQIIANASRVTVLLPGRPANMDFRDHAGTTLLHPSSADDLPVTNLTLGVQANLSVVHVEY